MQINLLLQKKKQNKTKQNKTKNKTKNQNQNQNQNQNKQTNKQKNKTKNYSDEKLHCSKEHLNNNLWMDYSTRFNYVRKKILLRIVNLCYVSPKPFT